MSGPPISRGERVLVRLPAWLGDLIMSEPCLRALLARVGSERLTLAGNAHLSPASLNTSTDSASTPADTLRLPLTSTPGSIAVCAAS